MSLLPRADHSAAVSPHASPAAPSNAVHRRTLFAGVTAVGAVAAVAALMPKTSSVDPVPVAQEPLAPPERGGGYALTERVKQYYQTARV